MDGNTLLDGDCRLHVHVPLPQDRVEPLIEHQEGVLLPSNVLEPLLFSRVLQNNVVPPVCTGVQMPDVSGHSVQGRAGGMQMQELCLHSS